jgi:galactokinase
MDQFASSCCKAGHAILIDCRSSKGKLVSFQDPNVCLVVANTNIKHSHSGGEYGARVRECKEASAELDVKMLRDVLDVKIVESIKNETVRKRARHVVSENERALKAAEAAERQDWTAFGGLMNQSHDSLKLDFEVSCQELDFLVETAQSIPGVFGSRMTGGGFGGCTVSLVKVESADVLIEALEKAYSAKFSPLKCTTYKLTPEDGATVLEKV